jgi:hypothetical protein
VPGAAPQRGGVGARHHDRVDADLAHPDPAQRLPVVGAPVERARRVGELAVEAVEVREDLAVGRARLGALELGQPVVELALLHLRVDRRQRLLPQQRDRRVGGQQHAYDQQHARQRLQDAPHPRD